PTKNGPEPTPRTARRPTRSTPFSVAGVPHEREARVTSHEVVEIALLARDLTRVRVHRPDGHRRDGRTHQPLRDLQAIRTAVNDDPTHQPHATCPHPDNEKSCATTSS